MLPRRMCGGTSGRAGRGRGRRGSAQCAGSALRRRARCPPRRPRPRAGAGPSHRAAAGRAGPRSPDRDRRAAVAAGAQKGNASVRSPVHGPVRSFPRRSNRTVAAVGSRPAQNSTCGTVRSLRGARAIGGAHATAHAARARTTRGQVRRRITSRSTSSVSGKRPATRRACACMTSAPMSSGSGAGARSVASGALGPSFASCRRLRAKPTRARTSSGSSASRRDSSSRASSHWLDTRDHRRGPTALRGRSPANRVPGLTRVGTAGPADGCGTAVRTREALVRAYGPERPSGSRR